MKVGFSPSGIRTVYIVIDESGKGGCLGVTGVELKASFSSCDVVTTDYREMKIMAFAWAPTG